MIINNINYIADESNEETMSIGSNKVTFAIKPDINEKISSINEDQKSKSNKMTEVVEIHAPPPDVREEIAKEMSSSLISTITPPPPPPPPLESQISVSSNNSCKSATLKSNHTISGNIHFYNAQSYLMHDVLLFLGLKTEKEVQEELKQVLMIFREKKEYYGKSIDREPVLDQYSTPREVQKWLTFKGYSEKYFLNSKKKFNLKIFKFKFKFVFQNL